MIASTIKKIAYTLTAGRLCHLRRHVTLATTVSSFMYAMNESPTIANTSQNLLCMAAMLQLLKPPPMQALIHQIGLHSRSLSHQ